MTTNNRSAREICPEMQAMKKMANLTIFCQRPKFKRISSRQGYQQSGDWNDGEFGERGKFDDISPNTKIQANELKTKVPTKREYGEFGENGEFDNILPKT